MKRYIDEAELLKRVQRIAGPEAALPVQRWLAKQPTAPELVSVTGAAEILDVHKTHVIKIRKQGRFPEGIPVLGAAEVYVRDEVEALREELAKTRRRPLEES